MKTAHLRSFVAASVLALLSTATHAAPAVSVKEAVQIAEEALAAKTPNDGVYIDSIALTRASVFNGKVAWTVTWSSAIPASKPGDKEVGLEIAMDGSVTHLVKGHGSAAKAEIPQHIGHP